MKVIAHGGGHGTLCSDEEDTSCAATKKKIRSPKPPNPQIGCPKPQNGSEIELINLGACVAW
ncbi:hypothetical protein ACS0TY_025903 [Phlomoides rotata]